MCPRAPSKKTWACGAPTVTSDGLDSEIEVPRTSKEGRGSTRLRIRRASRAMRARRARRATDLLDLLSAAGPRGGIQAE